MVAKKILVTGGTGMVGSCYRDFSSENEFVLLGSNDYDLTNSAETYFMIRDHTPDAIIHLAARVGGVKGNTDFVADFFKDNILINTNLLTSAAELGVKKVISLLSTCVYPDDAVYPLTPDQFHNGPPHKSNFGYAYSKRMVDVYSRALRQQYGCNFICAVPNNLYGINDNFDLENGHVIPAIIRKVHEAKTSGTAPVFWGDGSALREFTYAADISKILFYLVENYDDEEPLNIGTTEERSIESVVTTICSYMGYNGDVIWDKNKPSGQARKPSSNRRLLELGWKEEDYTSFEDGIKMTCDWYLNSYPNVRGVKFK